MPTMRAAIWHGAGDIRVEEVERPQIRPNEALVRTRVAGICGSDLHHLTGRWQPPEGHATGHEASGEVADVGADVTSLSVGDRVCLEPFIYCGECYHCRRGETNLCLNSGGYVSATCHGGFAEFFAAPVQTLHRLPDELTLAEGALVEPFAVSMHALRLARTGPEDAVLVLGAGTIGLTAVAAAKVLGARLILCTAKHPHQARMATQLSASKVIGTDQETVEKETKAATDGLGADVVVETVGGVSDTTETALKAVRTGGTVMLVGAYPKPLQVPLSMAIFRELRIIGSNCYCVIDGKRDFHVCMDAMASGEAELAPLVTHTFPLEQMREAMQTALDKTSGAIKVQIVFP